MRETGRRPEGRYRKTVSGPASRFPISLPYSPPPEGRKAYLLRHYWDGFNFADSALVNSKETAEQGLADYFSLLSDETVDSMLAVESMEGFCSGMERYGYSRTEFMKKADSYLYNPESPCYDERIYRIYLERMLRSNWLDKAEKALYGSDCNWPAGITRGRKPPPSPISFRTEAEIRWSGPL